MEINKKMYKYTAIISMTIVLLLIFNLVKPVFTIADTTYGISSINYDKNEEVMSVTCSKLEEHVNSFLYWVSTEEEVPTKEDLDKLAEWCVKNAIKVVPVNSTTISDSIKIKKTGKYYAVMLLKKANEEGAEEYVKAFVATYVVNTPIKEEDLSEEDDEVEEEEEQPEQEPVKEEEEQPEQEPVKEEEEQPEQEPVKEEEEQPEQEPVKEEEEQPEQEPAKEEEEQPKQEPVKEEEEQPEQEPVKKEEEQPKQEPAREPVKIEEKQEPVKEDKEDKPLYVHMENKNDSNSDEYINIYEETEDESFFSNDIKINSQVQEDIPQAGSNETPLVVGIVLFSIIGIASFIKYLRIR